MTIEQHNILEELTEITEKCIKCGLCKELCPVFKAILEEQYSPRGHMILLEEKVFDSILFDCTLCKACEEKCPLNLKICTAIRKARNVLNHKEKENPQFKKMLKNLEEGKNPYL